MNKDNHKATLSLHSQMDFAETAYDLVATAIQEGVKTLCAAVPGIEIAPLGAGTEANPDDICGQVGIIYMWEGRTMTNNHESSINSNRPNLDFFFFVHVTATVVRRARWWISCDR